MPDLKGTMINRRKMLQGMAAGVGTVAGLSPLKSLADQKNPESPNSPYVSVVLGCGILRFCESQCFPEELGRTVGLRLGSSELL